MQSQGESRPFLRIQFRGVQAMLEAEFNLKDSGFGAKSRADKAP